MAQAAIAIAIEIAISYAMNWLFPPEPVMGPRLNDLGIQLGTYGQMIPFVRGTVRITRTNMIWTTGLLEHKETSTSSMLGKKGPETTLFSYTASWATVLCEGPIAGVRRVWFGTKLIYDGKSTPLVGEVTATKKKGVRFTVYDGTQTTADPWMETYKGAGNVPAYINTAYIVFHDVALAGYGNRIPDVNVEVITSKTNIFPAVSPNDDIEAIDPTIEHESVSLSSFHDYVVVTGTGSDSLSVVVNGTNETIAAIHTGTENIISAQIGWDGFVYTCGMSGDGTTFFGQTVHFRKYDPISLALIDHVSYGGMSATSHFHVHDYIAWCDKLTGSVICLDLGFGEFFYRTDLGGGAFGTGPTAVVMDGSHGYAYIVFNGAIQHHSYIQKYTPTGLFPVATSHEYYPTVVGGIWWDYNSLQILFNSTAGWYTLDDGLNEILGPVVEPGDASMQQTIVEGVLYVTAGGGGGTVSVTDDVGVTFTYKTIGYALDTAALTVGDVVGGTNGALAGSPQYDPNNAAFWLGTNHVYIKLADATYDLATLVEDISVVAGYNLSSDIDASHLVGTDVRGYFWDTRAPTKDWLEPLMFAYNFDAVESDWKIKFRHRGTASVMTVNSEDLAVRGYGEDSVYKMVEDRIQQLDLPEEISIKYLDVDMDQTQSVQMYRRHVDAVGTRQKRDFTVPLVFTADEAKAVVKRAMAIAYSEQHMFDFTTFMLRHSDGDIYGAIDPTDVIQVNDGNVTFTMKVETAELGANQAVHITGRSIQEAVYSLTAIGEGAFPDSFVGTRISQPASAFLATLDVAAPTDAQATDPTVMMAISSFSTGVAGASVLASDDSGQTFTVLDSIDRQAVQGSSTTALPNAPSSQWQLWDDTNTINVTTFNSDMTFSSATQLQVYNGSNMLLVGGEWVQFKTATQTGARTWQLTSLLRGRRGTESYVSSHQAGERVILYTGGAALKKVTVESTKIGRPLKVKAVAFGEPVNFLGAASFTFRGNNLKPYAVANVTSSRDGSNNITVSWVARQRKGAEWLDYVDVSEQEDITQYEIEVYDDAGTTLKGTVVVNDAVTTTALTAAYITGLGLTPANARPIKIYKMSATVGRGFVKAATV